MKGNQYEFLKHPKIINFWMLKEFVLIYFIKPDARKNLEDCYAISETNSFDLSDKIFLIFQNIVFYFIYFIFKRCVFDEF